MDSQLLDNIIKQSLDYAAELEHEYVTCEHILHTLLECAEIKELAETMDVDRDSIRQDIESFLGNDEFSGLKSAHGTKVLQRKQPQSNVLSREH